MDSFPDMSRRSRLGGNPGLGLGQALRCLGRSPGRRSWSAVLGGGRVIPVHQARLGIVLGCWALGLREGEEVLVPAYNCGSEVDALMKAGLRVTMYRVDRQCRIDLDDVQSRIRPSTRLLYATHYFGWTHDLALLKQLCTRHGLLLFEDCALALFSHGPGGPAGSAGDAAVFSLPKTLPAPDGGALVLKRPVETAPSTPRRRPPLAGVVRRLASLIKSDLTRHQGFPAGPLLSGLRRCGSEDRAGTNGRPEMPSGYYVNTFLLDCTMSRVSANVLEDTPIADVAGARRRNYQHLLSALRDYPGIRFLYSELPEGVCPLVMPVLVEERDAVCAELIRRGIAAIPWWAGYHREFNWDEFPDARFLKDSVLALPIHQQLGSRDMEYISTQVRSLLAAF